MKECLMINLNNDKMDILVIVIIVMVLTVVSRIIELNEDLD